MYSVLRARVVVVVLRTLLRGSASKFKDSGVGDDDDGDCVSCSFKKGASCIIIVSITRLVQIPFYETFAQTRACR